MSDILYGERKSTKERFLGMTMAQIDAEIDRGYGKKVTRIPFFNSVGVRLLRRAKENRCQQIRRKEILPNSPGQGRDRGFAWPPHRDRIRVCGWRL